MSRFGHINFVCHFKLTCSLWSYFADSSRKLHLVIVVINPHSTVRNRRIINSTKDQRRRHKRLATSTSPYCLEIGGLTKIIYGMPGEDFGFENFIVGGCCETGRVPEIGFVPCGWEGMRADCN